VDDRSPAPRRRPHRPWWQRLRWDRLAILLTPPTLLVVVIGLLLVDDSNTVATPDRTPTSTTTTTWRVPRTSCRAVSAFTQHQKLAQLVMVTLKDVTPAEVSGFTSRDDAPGGLFFPKFPLDPGAITAISADLAAYPGLAAIDDEGGRVNRLAAANYPSARKQAATLSLDEVRALGAARAAALRSLGVNMDLAPVVDVSSEPDAGPIGDRSYSDDPKAVIRNAGAFAVGLRSGGVLPTLKHFPGHGRASGDSHSGVVTTPSWASLKQVDLAPYRPILKQGTAAVMVGHLDVPGLTEANTPASLSPAAYRALRKVIGFAGLAITDDIGGMGAVTTRYSTADAVVLALVAGADLALVAPPSAYDAVLTRLDAAVTSGQLTTARVDEAFGRVRAAQGCPG